MSDLFSQLGVEPAALLWQTANFAVVLGTLWYLVYKPLTSLVAERTSKIEKGLSDAVQAQAELARADADYAARLRDAEREGTDIVKRSEAEAQKRASSIITNGEARGESIVAEARTLAERARAEEFASLEAEAKAFVQAVVAKTVALDPSTVDAKLVEQAVAAIKSQKHAV